jgi:arabinofuranosyltransferase
VTTATAISAAPAESTVPEPSRVPRARWGNALAVALPVLAVAVLGWRHRALTDDGTIFLRTVRQILAGNGPTVNLSERVEADTSTLWQWLLVVFGAVTPGDLGFTAVLAGILLTAAGFAVALDATRRLHTAAGPRHLLPAGALVPLAVPVFWDFAGSGLDSGLGTFWLGGCWWLLVRAYRSPDARGRAGYAVWAGLGFLVRPDFAIVTAVFLAGLWWVQRPGPRQACGQLAAALALPVAYEVFRAGYYGLLVPMPGLTKEPGDSDPVRGLRYAADFAGPLWLYVPLALLGALAVAHVLRSRPAPARWVVPLVPVAAAALHAGYVVRIGGDYMHGRMLLPALFLALLPVLLVPVRAGTIAVAAATSVWAVAVVGPWHPAAYHAQDTAISIRVRDSDIALTGSPNADHVAAWTAAFPKLRDAVAAGMAADRPVLVRLAPDMSVGQLLPLGPGHGSSRVSFPGGFLGVTGALLPLDQYIVETWGLANTVGAHLEYAPGAHRNWPGHRKPLGDVWLLALELDPSVTDVPGIAAVTPASLAAARRALGCGDLRELLASVREPLTASRFLRNLAGAYHRTALRIPRDPFAAEAKFCGAR